MATKPTVTPEPAYAALESLPLEVPWRVGGSAVPMRVVYDLVKTVDLTAPRYNELMAPFLAEERRIMAAQTALDAAAATDPPPADLAAQQAALQADYEANSVAGVFHLIAHLVVRVEGLTPAPVPTDPATWAHLHPELRKWLVGPVALAEVQAQLTSPLAQIVRTA